MKTKRLFLFCLISIVLTAILSCMRDTYYTIPLSSDEVKFSNAGGSTTVKCLDGNPFASATIVGQGEYQQKIDEEWYYESCDWLTIKYSRKNSTELEIIVENNTTGKERTADVEMERPGYNYGSARIKVIQTK